MEALGRALATNSTLRTLKLDGTDRNVTDMAPLARGIYDGASSGSLRLRRLHAACIDLTDESAVLLGEALASPRGCSLREVGLEISNIRHESITTLLEKRTIAGSGLKKLMLSECKAREAEVEAISEHLTKPWCEMEELVLIYSSVDDWGAMALGRALTLNTTLKVLDL